MNDWWLLSVLFGLTVLASIFIVYPIRRHFMASFLLIPIIFLTAFAGYFFWGDFSSWQHYLHLLDSQKKAEEMLKTIKSPQELIEKLRAKLDDTPKNAKGWYLLGRLYSSQNEKQNAVNAFKKAYLFHPEDELYAVNFAHSLWVLNNHQFSEQITEIFSHLLKINPNQPDALSMLAMDAFTRNAYEDAIDYWQRLLTIVPTQSDEAQAIRKAIAQAQARIPLKNKTIN